MDNNVDLSKMIEKLMSDPSAMEMVQKLKQGTVSQGNAPVIDTPTPVDVVEQNNSSDVAKLMSSLAPILNSIGKNVKSDSPDTKRRNQLLYALKPYLSPERQEIIDTLTSLSGVTGILDILKDGGKK